MPRHWQMQWSNIIILFTNLLFCSRLQHSIYLHTITKANSICDQELVKCFSKDKFQIKFQYFSRLFSIKIMFIIYKSCSSSWELRSIPNMIDSQFLRFIARHRSARHIPQSQLKMSLWTCCNEFDVCSTPECGAKQYQKKYIRNEITNVFIESSILIRNYSCSVHWHRCKNL